MNFTWTRVLPVVLALGTLLVACRRHPPETDCEATEIRADRSTSAPRPDESKATFHFSGNHPQQREFIFVHPDGTYDYVERWNFGLPAEKDLSIDLGSSRNKGKTPQGQADDDDSLLELAGRPLEKLWDWQPLEFPSWDDQLQFSFGFDWKVGCRMHMCPQPDGSTCCYQRCEDGGETGTAYEPPDRFSCMNAAAGGRYDWFIAGLKDGGMSELAACETKR